MALQLHPQWKCPCGAEFGDLTDHAQGERHCPAHLADGYRGGVPQYVPGKETPEAFAGFVDEQDAKGLPVSAEAREFVNKARGITEVPPPAEKVKKKK